MTNKTILVTGATGKVGGQAAKQLAERGTRVRALVRNPDTATLPDGVEVVRGDLLDLASVESALSGVDAVFLVWPLFSPDGAAEVVDAIKRHARQVVYLSMADAQEDGTMFHGELERLIEASGLDWTFLQPSGFAGNTLGFAPQIKEGDVVRGLYGGAARSLIHETDMAAVGIKALTEDGHFGKRYVITGPEAIRQIDQVRLIGEAIGRPLRFEERTPAEERAVLLAAGMPEVFIDNAFEAWAKLVTNPEPVTSTVDELLGRPAIPFAQWARDHAADFR